MDWIITCMQDYIDSLIILRFLNKRDNKYSINKSMKEFKQDPTFASLIHRMKRNGREIENPMEWCSIIQHYENKTVNNILLIP